MNDNGSSLKRDVEPNIHENNQSSNNNLIQYTMFNFANMGVFLGVSSYAFESIGSIFNVRKVMQQRSAMPRLQMDDR